MRQVSILALERAAQVWCEEETQHITMSVPLCLAFARALDEVWSKPWLGNATTGELLNELRTRLEVDGRLNYRTVDPQ